MHDNKIDKYKKRINQLKEELQKIGDMRPGSLTRQTYKRVDYTRDYWQISYTQNQKSKTEYVRDSLVKTLRQEISEYQKFKKLNAEWVELAIKISKEQIKLKKSAKTA